MKKQRLPAILAFLCVAVMLVVGRYTYKDYGMTLDEYKEKLTEAAATEMEDVVINGMEAVSYVLEETDTACVSFVTEAGYIFEVSGSPMSDENFAALLSMVMASIQAE